MFSCLMFNLIVFIIRFLFRCLSFDLLILQKKKFTHDFPQVNNNVTEQESVSVWYLLCFYLTAQIDHIKFSAFVTLLSPPPPTLAIIQWFNVEMALNQNDFQKTNMMSVHCSLHRLKIFVFVFSYLLRIMRLELCVCDSHTSFDLLTKTRCHCYTMRAG